jgi:hypothetical protein
MLKITFINGDVQNIAVTGDFFTITPVTDSKGKPTKLTPTQKAEALAFDLADAKKTQVAYIDLFYPDQTEPKSKFFRHVDDRDRLETGKPTPSYLKELKALKKEHRHSVPTNHKGYKTRWVWSY